MTSIRPLKRWREPTLSLRALLVKFHTIPVIKHTRLNQRPGVDTPPATSIRGGDKGCLPRSRILDSRRPEPSLASKPAAKEVFAS